MNKGLENEGLNDLVVPIYLDRNSVLDLLAMVENGFTTISQITSASSQSQGSEKQLSGEASTGSIIPFFSARLSAGIKGKNESDLQEQIKEERTHTTASLFYRLKTWLEENSLVKNLHSIQGIDDVSAGEFVCVRAILRQNPLIELFDSFTSLMDVVLQINPELATQKVEKSPPGGGHKPKIVEVESENVRVLRQIKSFSKTLTSALTIDVISKISASSGPDISIVIPVFKEAFYSGSLKEVIDGEFKVIGKVARVLPPDSTDHINLLRKTSLKAISKTMMGELITRMKSDNPKEIVFPELVTDIFGPAIQIHPIAIYL